MIAHEKRGLCLHKALRGGQHRTACGIARRNTHMPSNRTYGMCYGMKASIRETSSCLCSHGIRWWRPGTLTGGKRAINPLVPIRMLSP